MYIYIFFKLEFKGIQSRLCLHVHGQTNSYLRLLTLDLSTQKLLFTDTLIPQQSIVTKKIIFYMNYGHLNIMFLDWIC